ncbi:MAG: SIS domain-containing protein [Fibromonadaceae bacterium]|jgi:arabinose-5-phosphate isomerase|nr:SIS domain-containing protein [Fibromonadaceae bacterium]
MKKYFASIIENIDLSFAGLDEASFSALLADCENTIKNGGKIVASGLGKNVPICEKFVGMMNSLGLESAFLHTNTAMHGDIGLIKENDIVLILSKSGSTAESVLFAEYIKEHKAKKWLLSFNDGGSLAKIVPNKLLLPLKHEGDAWDIVPNNSSSCYLILLQGLALYLAERVGVKLEDFKKNHPGGAIGKKLGGQSL